MRASANHDILVMGETNLDWLTWNQPSAAHEGMVNKVKQDIETLGYYQMVSGATRTWPGQQDSLLDQVWLNCPGRKIYIKNLDRAFSDHNLVIVSLRTKNILEDRHDSEMRDRTNWNPVQCSLLIDKIDWTDLKNSTDLDFINTTLETEILNVLDKMAPVKPYQARNSNKRWVTEDLKLQMDHRNSLKQEAKQSGRRQDWDLYRQSRNQVVKNLRKCKDQCYAKLYDNLEKEHDTKGLYKLTNKLTGIHSGSTPQQFLLDGRIIRKPQEMATVQLDFYVKKLEMVNAKLTASNRNPHRLLDTALNNWADKDAHPVF